MVVVQIIDRTAQRQPNLAVSVRRTASATPGAPPVLLVHGMGGDHSTWRRLSRTLAEAGRGTIAVDLRGHGRSGHASRYGLDDFGDDLASVLDVAGAGRVDVIAHSLGAHSALRLAMKHPGRVRRMVLEEPPPMPQNEDDLAEKIVPAFTGLGDRLRGIRALAANPLPFVRFDRAMPDAVGLQFERTDPRWWDRLEAVTAPALVVSGGDRSFLPTRHLRRVAQALPHGRLVTIDSGHSVHRDRPRAFADAAGDHLLG